MAKFKVNAVEEIDPIPYEGRMIRKFSLILENEIGEEQECSALTFLHKVGEEVSGKINEKVVGDNTYYNFKEDKPKTGKSYGGGLSKEEWEAKDKHKEQREDEKEARTNLHIQRQGFLNAVFSSVLPTCKDVSEFVKKIKDLEPIYRNYVENGKLPEEKK